MIKKMDFWTSFVLYGKYGVGKTTTCCTAPKPIALIDADNKARNQVNIQELIKSGDVDLFPIDHPLIAGNDLDYIFKPDEVNKIPEGYRCFVKTVNRIVKEEKKEYATIIVDSGSMIVQHLVQAITATNNKTQMTPQLWLVFHTEMSNRLTRLSSVPVNFVWTFHERLIEDETTKKQQVVASIPGQMGDDIGRFFNEVYNVRVDEINGKHYYYLVTRSNGKYNNRTSGNLELNEYPNLQTIIDKLTGRYVEPPPKPKAGIQVKPSGITTVRVGK